MNRFGWLFIICVLLGSLAFAVLVDFRADPPRKVADPVAAPTAPRLDLRLAVPVVGIESGALQDTWGQSRAGGVRTHKAIDIMAPRGTPVVAAADGTVEKLFDSVAGGRTIYIRNPDQRTIYYYAHLDAYRTGLAEGRGVVRGESLATVGSTGNANPGAPHLHFEIKRMRIGEPWWKGEEINPYPLLAGAREQR